MKKIFLILLGLASILLFSQKTNTLVFDRGIDINGIEGVVFAFTGNQKITFIPTDIDIQNFEKRVKIEKGSCKEYVRQYVGVVNNNEKIIKVLFIHKRIAEKMQWKKNFTIVEGGGDNYINVTYSIKQDRIVNFYENSIE